jgi:Multicopper oxidase
MRISVLLLTILTLVTSAESKVRHYYIAAEDCTWDYAPSGVDLVAGRLIPWPWNQKTKWEKTRFFEYTDDTFTVRKPQPEWLGILGPIIRAEVGDEIIVDFLNRSKNPHSIHPHGLRYDKKDEGAYYIPVNRGGLVPHNARYTYHWFADERSGPGPGQPSSIVWWYHSHTNPAAEINAGLLGPIIVTAKGKAKPDGSPKDVDDEFVAAFMIFDELNGKDAGMFYAINGYIFGNLPGLVMKKGDRVRWYLMGMGSEKDLHTPHWHGERVTAGGRNMDVVELLPASTVTVDMVADNPGVWLFHCHVSEHMESGMMALYTIYEPQQKACPVQITSGKFYDGTGKYSVVVKNSSPKPIKQLVMMSEHILTPQYVRRPFDAEWTAPKPLEPGQEEVLERDAYRQGGDSILGWALFPYSVVYEDGSKWSPQHNGECFQVYWRDNQHPDLKVLPPALVNMND